MRDYNFNARRPSQKYHKADLGFLVAVILLWGFGMFTMFFCTQSYAARFFDNDVFHFVRHQLICSAVGLVLFLVFLLVDMPTIKRVVPYLLILTIILMLLTYIKPLSVEKNGARRWLKLPLRFTFQPSELVKMTLILYLAAYFDNQVEKYEEIQDRNYARCVGVFVFLMFLIVLQKDFSTTIFIVGVVLIMFVVSGAKIKWMLPFFLLLIPIAIILIASEEYRLERLLAFLRPTTESQGKNFQSNAAKAAISAGGYFGVGIGRGLSKLNRIPEVQADYIFAGWSEAMGYIGVVGYFIMLSFFAWRGYKAAFECPDRFAAYGAFGCVSMIVLQSLLNCMVVCGLLPSTGIPLPFFSVGGSSIMITLAMCGFVLNASRCEEPGEVYIKSQTIDVNTITIL